MKVGNEKNKREFTIPVRQVIIYTHSGVVEVRVWVITSYAKGWITYLRIKFT